MIKKILALFAFSAISLIASPQKGNYEFKKEIPFQPMFVLGSSYYSFQGDIRGPKSNALLGNIGYSAGVLFNLNSKFNCKLSISNASFFESNQDFSFSSNANLYSVDLNYLMEVFEKSKINPYTKVGISSISYNTYNVNNFKKDYAVVVPLGIGLELNVSERIKLNVGMDYCISNADIDKDELSNADNYMTANFNIAYDLFTKKHKKAYVDESFYADVNYSILDNEDSDGDNIADIDDHCPYTPKNIRVDESGCPIDSDLDGIPDYIDKEKNTLPGTIVDQYGVTLDLKSFLYNRKEVASRNYANFYNEFELKKSDFKDVNDYLIAKANAFNLAFNIKEDIEKIKDTYRVKLSEHYEKVPASIINKYLSIEDLISVSNEKDAVVYAVGSYDNVIDAIERQSKLEENGMLETEIIIDKAGSFFEYKIIRENLETQESSTELDSNKSFANDISTKLEKNELVVLDSLSKMSKNEKNQNLIKKDSSKKTSKLSDDKLIYRIQIGAFKSILSKEIFNGVNDVVFFKGRDNLYRYNSGSFDNYQEAVLYLSEMRGRGFKDAFIVTYKGGERIGLSSALSNSIQLNSPTANTFKDKRPKSKNSVNENETYLVQIGIYSNNLDANRLKLISNLKSVNAKKISNKLTSYHIEKIPSLEEAKITLSNIKSMGFEKAFIIKKKNGVRVPFSN